MPLELAVHQLTGRPAALYGLRERGQLVPGRHADLVVFDPDAIGPAPVTTRYDMPGGAGRLHGGAHGIHHVLVNGVAVVDHDRILDGRPGRLLRSGRATSTFELPVPAGAEP